MAGEEAGLDHERSQLKGRSMELLSLKMNKHAEKMKEIFLN